MATLSEALVMGVVEGVTEFLPVSSTGHLIVVGELLGIHDQVGKTFEIFIQLGAILAIVVLFYRRFLSFLTGKASSKVFHVALCCFPAALLGLILHSPIKKYLFSPFTVAVGFVVGALLIIYAERRKTVPEETTDLSQLSFKQALLVGLFQCLALWPGMSRSGCTIIGAKLLGCSRSLAAEFSFLCAVPLLAAAAGYDLYKSRELLTSQDLPFFAIGLVTAFVSALLTVRWFIAFVARTPLTAFAWYRIGAAIVIVYLLSGQG